MIFKLEEEHISVKEAAREFANTRLKEGVIDRDSSMEYPTELVKEMGNLGFLSMMQILNMEEVEWTPCLMLLQWKKFRRLTTVVQ